MLETNIHDYFKEKFGHEPYDTGGDSLQELPVESNCGRDCKEVIDAAAAFLAVLDHHIGVQEYNDKVVSIVNDTILILWLG